MGRKESNKYKKTLHQQVHEHLQKMLAIGESKQKAKEDGTYRNKIFSFDTYRSYKKHIGYFIKYMTEAHPECTTLKKARRYVREWLELRVQQGYSAYTIHLEVMALNKLFGIQQDDPDFFRAPQRHRCDIKRSRGEKVRDKHFSEKNNQDFVDFCRATGLRRREVLGLKGGNVMSIYEVKHAWKEMNDIPVEARTKEEQRCIKLLEDALLFDQICYDFVIVRNGKGGKKRLAPIIGANAQQVAQKIMETPTDKKVWTGAYSCADIHGYRADYAVALYGQNARPIEDIPYDKFNCGTKRWYQSQVYVCRKDLSGLKLDKNAMMLCSKALGHNRLDVVANHYLGGLYNELK